MRDMDSLTTKNTSIQHLKLTGNKYNIAQYLKMVDTVRVLQDDPDPVVLSQSKKLEIM